MSNVLPMVRKKKQSPERNRLTLNRELFINDGIALAVADDLDAMIWVQALNNESFERLKNAFFLTH